MISMCCKIYAYTIAVVWSGLGYEMLVDGCVIYTPNANVAAGIAQGCLSLRAVTLVGLCGGVLSVLSLRFIYFPISIIIGIGGSWLKCFALVYLLFRFPNAFTWFHSCGGYFVFISSIIFLCWLILQNNKSFR